MYYKKKGEKKMAFTKRSIGMLYVLMIVTFGIYTIYWFIKTKGEINQNYNENIPTCWFMIIPIVNIYWLFRFTEVFTKRVRQKDVKEYGKKMMLSCILYYFCL